jgi:DNA (cytosine-5)-methyltransferase 1
LDGERSGLFMEQIRIIKEIREHDRAIRGADVDFRLLRPRYMVWENVPGAFSSNKGEDFRVVLEETARIVDKDTVIPRPEGGVETFWVHHG